MTTPESAIRTMRREADRAEADVQASGKRDPGVNEWFLGWANGIRWAADKFAASLGTDCYIEEES